MNADMLEWYTERAENPCLVRGVRVRVSLSAPRNALLAQWLEHALDKRRAGSSNLSGRTIISTCLHATFVLKFFRQNNR